MQHFGTNMPTSPLPDSGQLEAGIIQDERPTRLSRVQDNVRHLLRTSMFGSVASSLTSPAHDRPWPAEPTPIHPTQPSRQDLRSPQWNSPLRSDPILDQQRHQPARTRFPVLPSSTPSRPVEVFPSPTDSTASNTRHSSHGIGDFPCPPSSYQRNFGPTGHDSALFNRRAVAALDHPDLSDSSLTNLSRVKTHRRPHRGWTRHRHGSSGSGSRSPRSKKRKHGAARRPSTSQGLLCFLASFLLAALVATYVSLATTVDELTTTFHVLFILGILLATIVFIHAWIRLFLATKRPSRALPTFVRATEHGHYERSHHHRQRHLRPEDQTMPVLGSDDVEAFVPPTPIHVHVPGDEVQADPVMAQPTATQTPPDWDKDVQTLVNPPPAYGRWRDSVRANPDLLHWAPSPVSPLTPAMPSPTYEEAMSGNERGGGFPPGYETRDGLALAGTAQPRDIQPEMVEARAVGVGAGVGRAM